MVRPGTPVDLGFDTYPHHHGRGEVLFPCLRRAGIDIHSIPVCHSGDQFVEGRRERGQDRQGRRADPVRTVADRLLPPFMRSEVIRNAQDMLEMQGAPRGRCGEVSVLRSHLHVRERIVQDRRQDRVRCG